MKSSEAIVFMIENDAIKRGQVTGFIEETGGEVVGHVDTREEGHRVVNDASFPASVENANTVLIDGNLSVLGGYGTEGKHVFLGGYERGVLHRVDAYEGIGAVAIGCSADNRSDVAYVTGGNFDRAYRLGAAARWAELLQPHPADPTYLSPGTIERMQWGNYTRFGEMMKHIIKPGDTPSVTVHALSVTETKKEGEKETVTYLDETNVATEFDTMGFVARAGNWQGDENGNATADSHTVRALVQAGSHLYVVNHSTRVRNNGWVSDLVHKGNTDKIAISNLAELPDAYWENLGIARPAL